MLAPLAGLISLSPFLLGCNGGKPATGQVSGTVTFKGSPVREGRVTFHSDSGPSYDAKLTPDGSYTIEGGVTVGDYKVTVEPLIVRRRVDPRGPEVGDEKAAPDIPQRNRTPGSTELRATVKEGKNELNFDMKP
jgi:hypothetical protein